MTLQMTETPTCATPARRELTRAQALYRPNVDIVEGADELLVYADMPGTDPANIDIQFENGTLTISGTVPQRQTGETRFLLREYGVGNFRRTFEVSEAVNASAITAEYSNGVLVLHLPKVEAVKPRKIEVRVN